MTSRLYRDEAIVLRTYKLGEADRIIVLLTRHHGQVRAVAKGVRRTSSRFGARLEPFSMIDVQLHAGRNLDVVTQAEIIDPFGRAVCADYAMFTCASTMVETAERLSADDGDLGTEASPQQYLLLAGALAAMSHRRHAPRTHPGLLPAAGPGPGGWGASCYDCALCGALGPHRAFHVQVGGAVCESCRSAGAVEVEPATMVLLGALLSGDWAVADASGQRERSQASGLVSAYTTWYLERRLRSLALVERA